jgi:type IV pilus assembly protein PilX
MPMPISCGAHGQRGVTLVIVLLILVVVTILGIGGAQIALLGERSTRYDRDYLIASQAAEAALMDAEFDIRGPNTSGDSRVAQFTQANFGIFVAGCSTSAPTRGLCLPNADGVRPVWADDTLLDTGATARSVEFGDFTDREFDIGGTGGIKPARAPRYVIELVPDPVEGGSAKMGSGLTAAKMYRITAMGFGPREDIQVVQQIAFRKEK